MADQLANAMKNADLFTQTQDALAEAEALYEVTQALSTARDEETVYRLVIDFMAQAKVDSAAVYVYVTQETADNSANRVIEQKAVWSAADSPGLANGTRFDMNDLIAAPFTGRQNEIIIENAPHNQSLSQALRAELERLGIASMLALPLSTHQKRLGLLLATYKTENKKFSKNQVRYFNTIAQQMVVALENLQLLDDSQRRARREEIIREITGKIRGAADVNEILKTTVSEVGKLVGAPKGRIVLGTTSTNGDATNGQSAE
jgi:GAF domain-containing protein